MNELLYQMIGKRRSFHVFRGMERPMDQDIQDIQDFLPTLRPLLDHIKVAFRIVPRKQTSCKTGSYCILIYSQETELWLENVGYMGQQLDLWLASRDIGACWFGMAKPDMPQYQGLSFAIMIVIAKAEPSQFRPQQGQAKRKTASQIWQGESLRQLAETARLAPSAVNTQPWLVRCQGPELRVYRVRGWLPIPRIAFYNQIDMGIFLLILELCLDHEHIPFQRELSPASGEKESLVATYHIE